MFWGKKSIEEKIKAKVTSTLSKKIAELINDHIEPCVEYSADEKTSPVTGDSKAGGLPHFLPAALIPQYQSRPLKLIMQINCKDLRSLENFPHEGMLYIFMDVVDMPEALPERNGQFKVVYLPEIPVNGHADNKAEEGSYKRSPIPTFSIHESQSYIFDGTYVAEKDFYGLMDLSYGVIDEIVGSSGSIRIGGVPAMRAVWSWAYQHLGYVDSFGVTDWAGIERSGAEAENKARQIIKDFELIYTEILDGYGHTDSWICIGIHKEDLKSRKFENAYAAFDAT